MHARSCRRSAAAFAVAALALAALPSVAPAADRPATPATFGSVFSAAQAGDTILLASGDYGTFGGAQKPGNVTIRPQPGASATMRANFRPASNITLEGLKITGLEISNAGSKNITVRNSNFDQAQANIRTGDLSNANVLLEGNVFSNFVKCSNCGEGRIELSSHTSQPSGVTIRHNLFSGGNSDGIQNGGNGVQILENEFTGIQQVDGSSGVHADSIQLYGSVNTVIRGNWFHNVAVGIMCADQCSHETVQDNVFAVNGSPYAITWLSDTGSVIRHNTFVDRGICDYNARCGTVYLGNKSADPASQGTVLKDNILGSFCVCDGSSSGLADESFNLFTKSGGSGPSDLKGTPTYVGGAASTTYAGFALAPGSLGKGSASDGTDRGARVNGVPGVGGTGAAAPPPASSAPAGSAPGAVSGLVAAYGFDGRRGLRVADASGKGNRGRVHGAKRTRHGHSGRALAFDGVNDFVLVRDGRSLDLRRGMTLEAWVRPAKGSRVGQAVISKRRGRGVSYGLYAGDRSGRPAAFAAGKRGAHARGKLRRGHWTHLAVTFDGAYLRLFVDGQSAGARKRSGRLRASGGPLRIGAGAGAGFFKGRIDDVRIYKHALDPGQIQQDMRTPV